MNNINKRLLLGFILSCLFTPAILFADKPHEPNLGKDGSAYMQSIVTQSGSQLFVPNIGFTDGSNFTKIFGPKKSTTLWDDGRRAKCYELSLRIMAQMPIAREFESLDRTLGYLNLIGFGVDVVGDTASSLNALHNNYIEGKTVMARLSNTFSKQLRYINPKSIHGAPVNYTNLKLLGKAMDSISKGLTIYDFAVGAAIQEALAGDLALSRLDMIKTILYNRKQSNLPVDPMIFVALNQARKNLERSEDYWGALLIELSDRRSELVKLGLSIGIKKIQAYPVKLLSKYYASHLGLGAKAAATKATTVAGLWGWSLLATYKTIDSLLTQHENAQISVTSATLAYLLEDEIKLQRLTETKMARAVILQAKYSYFNQMTSIASGFLPGFYDLLSKGQPYKDVKEHFYKMRNQTGELIKQLFEMDSPPATTQQIIIAIVDSSGSMSNTDPKNLRKAALNMMIDTLSEDVVIGIVDFDDTATIITKPIPLGALNNSIRKDIQNRIRKIDSHGGTNIQAGLQAAVNVMGNTGQDTSFVLLTDGQDKNWKGETSTIPKGIPVHTVALSNRADRTGLSKISAATGGIPEIASNASDLHRIFSNLFGQAVSNEVLLTRSGTIQVGDIILYDFSVEPGIKALSLQTSWQGSDIDMAVTDPDGKKLTIEEAVNKGIGIEAETYDIIGQRNPKPGNWQARLFGVQLPAAGEKYEFRAMVRESTIKTDWQVNVPVPEIDQQMSITLNTEGGQINWEKAELKIWMPDGTVQERIEPLNSLLAAMSGQSGLSVFEFLPKVEGLHRVQIKVTGKSPAGHTLNRGFDRTFHVAVPGKGVKYSRDIDPFIRRRAHQ